ncbi:glycosyltransferase family 8 protein [Limosilactobacillus caecicola]|uniref:glycosyltransferase family 8 protein n=1 Tax=Limosilactobacillus caecicola TaxID=2941332 RepID=UPI00203FD9FD|nr:glycosyltransferase family 8 protein [Limosilactobacillus caecicola]
MTVPVFYTISDDFTRYAAVSLRSLIDHVNSNEDYVVYFLYQDLSDEHQAALRAMQTENVQVRFQQLSDELLAPIKDRQENYLRADFFTPSIFYRLFIPDLFPQYERVIYLDSDTVVNADIADLYRIDLGDNLFAACQDRSIKEVPEMRQYITDVLDLQIDHYINSGVLVMNAQVFREEHFTEHFFDLFHRYHFNCIAPDQDYLNEMGDGRIKYLPAGWDAMPNENTVPLPDPQLIHYNLFFKPWHFQPVQYGRYFWQAAKQTAFYRELTSELANYGDDQRTADRQKLETMLQKTAKVMQDPNNWARVKQREKVKL